MPSWKILAGRVSRKRPGVLISVFRSRVENGFGVNSGCHGKDGLARQETPTTKVGALCQGTPHLWDAPWKPRPGEPRTHLAPMNCYALLLPLLHRLVEEREGERRLPVGGASWHNHHWAERTHLPIPLPAARGEGIGKSRGVSIKMRPPAGSWKEIPDRRTRLAPMNRYALLLPLLHRLVEERAGERRLPVGSWKGLPALPRNKAGRSLCARRTRQYFSRQA